MSNNSTARLYPFDWLITGYSALMVILLVAFGEPFGAHRSNLVTYVLCGLAPFVILKLVGGNRTILGRAIRFLYPVILFTPLYRATGAQMFLFFDHFLDPKLIAFETSLFSIEPTVYIDQHLLQPLFNDLVTFCYACYYLMIPVFAIVLFKMRKDILLADATAAMCIMFFVSYLLFFLFPIEGPRWHQVALYQHSVDGYIFRPLVQFIQKNGAVHGGGMPSSHTGVALVILIYTWRVSRKWGMILTPIVCGLGMGALWGRYHYISDIIVGAAIGAASVWIVDHWLRIDQSGRPAGNARKVTIAHVS